VTQLGEGLRLRDLSMSEKPQCVFLNTCSSHLSASSHKLSVRTNHAFVPYARSEVQASFRESVPQFVFLPLIMVFDKPKKRIRDGCHRRADWLPLNSPRLKFKEN
jgi:hypothetical protein